jgi:hypothetical protein
MPLLGIDLVSARVSGVVVDGDGAVLRRAQRVGADASLQGVVDELSAGLAIEAFGIAIDAEPEAAVVMALKERAARGTRSC